ncbi:DUF222 domain-containing protein [Candidatus Poriferisocius sp.]|uniref:HNH endonuclease signature motif containing protein n=1 Tax=Candidatus Poriferisocius sp. TaxID=3101276 RepID=UPI003B0165C0
MRFEALTRDNIGSGGSAAVAGGSGSGLGGQAIAENGPGSGVHVDGVDVAGLNDAGLDARLRLIGDAHNRLDGFLVEAVAEKKRRSSAFDTADTLRRGLRQSGRKARSVIRDAEQLEALPAAREALLGSRITSEHARILGNAAKAGPMDEQEMVAAAETQTPEQLRRTVREHQDELSDDDGSKRLERQQKARTASFTEQDDGMWCLHALFDPITGQRIRAALNHKTDMAWYASNGRERQTARHRRADAIAELLTRNIQNTGGDGGAVECSQPTSLLILADYDVVDQKLGRPRLSDGTPLPAEEFRKLACDAEILTGIFNSDLQCLSLGRQRHPSPQLKATLIARDQGCIGCAKQPEWCVSHHIKHWDHGGPTQADNLVTICQDCHHKVHHRDWTVEKHPDTRRYYLRPPWQQPPKPTTKNKPHKHDRLLLRPILRNPPTPTQKC